MEGFGSKNKLIISDFYTFSDQINVAVQFMAFDSIPSKRISTLNDTSSVGSKSVHYKNVVCYIISISIKYEV